MDQIKTSDIARGRWPQILRAFGVPAKLLNGRKQPCPFCGGKDRFRFTDFKGTGTFFCNQCGTYPGFKFLEKYKGWDFKQAANEIDKLLANSSYVSAYPPHRDQMVMPPTRSPELAILMDETIPFDDALQMVSDLQWKRQTETKSVRDATLWLQKYVPERLEAWLDAHPPELRVWLGKQQDDR